MKSAFEELRKSRANLVSRFAGGAALDDFQDKHAEIVDQYFGMAFQENEIGQSLFRKKRPFAFVAVGGYGRKELSLFSDIDIIILFSSKIPDQAKELVNKILLPLWDLGLDLGHGIRTIKDCLNLSTDDFEVLTSMMDARFLCGDSLLYLSLMEELQKRVIKKKAAALTRWLEDQDKIRMHEFGDASYLLEPHLKEGIGGLRDYHNILWLARADLDTEIPRDLEYLGIFSHSEYNELIGNLRFIWLVRNYLHLLSGRKNDRLSFEYQEKIAGWLGFQNKKNHLAVEQLLERLHAYMGSVKSLHRSFLNSHLPKRHVQVGWKDNESTPTLDGVYFCQGEAYFESAPRILSDPLLLLGVFEHCAVVGCHLSTEARRLVREFLYLIDDTFREAARASEGFLNIISHPRAIGVLDQMFETGFLETFIPEFGQIKERVQFDAYHIFPVGRHCLETLRQLKEIERKKEILLFDIFSELYDPEPLFLAALFHDIGKAGKDHAHKGVVIAREILTRMGYDKNKMEEVLFLVGHHLLLVETSTRRDLNDEKVVVQCARLIGDMERLKMLYLLTWADSTATGPRAWNAWISLLVQELFFKIMHTIERKELATPHAFQKVEETKSEVRRLMATGMSAREVEAFLEVLTPRYLLNSTPHEIVRHFSIATDLGARLKDTKAPHFVLKTKEDLEDETWEIVFSARDKPGLFSDLAGVLALNNINVLSANIYTWTDGTALDVLRVGRPLDPINPQETWEKVQRDLENAFKGSLSLTYRLAQKAKPSILSERKKPSLPPSIVVDNEASDFFTLIEVFADDRVGILYDITRTLFDLRLDIRIAKIATKRDQTADVFYVLDLEGQKVEDEIRLKEIKEALLYELN
jgi:[protein-PII] uridylyltransferase